MRLRFDALLRADLGGYLIFEVSICGRVSYSWDKVNVVC